MALPIKQQLQYWGIAAAVFFIVLWYLGDILLPFIVGGAVAFFLDPIADRLEKLGLSRILATVVITLTAVLLFIVVALLVIPTLISQGVDLVNALPQMLDQIQTFLTDRFPQISDTESTIRKSLDKLGEQIQSHGGDLLNSLLSSILGVVNIAVLVVLVPVITFYLLLDWDHMVATLESVLPLDHAPIIKKLAKDINLTLAAFIRGQGTVCLVLGSYYAIALMAVGLQFGLVVGAIAGLITFIPYVGALFGGALAVGLAVFQFWTAPFWIVAVVIIFAIGQFIEGNILTPKLVGKSVGLHPVWLIFALSAFGTVFGFVGMLVAVPLAAALGVVARFFLGRYQESLLFHGKSGLAKKPRAKPKNDPSTGL
jgi:predicted PurR-regulated permease PerM